MNIRENIEEVRRRIEGARGERTQPVTLIAVTKTVSVDKMKEAYREGILDFGENRVQEILKKYEEFPKDVRWHLIGSLQTNKVKYIVDKVHMIHSLDRMSLAREIDKRAKEKNLISNCLVQVNISGENTKHGMSGEEVMSFIDEVSSECSNIKIRGLMGMAAPGEDRREVEHSFRSLKRLFEKIETMEFEGVKMSHLSMGMTNDYEIAVAEGSTMVRIGTGIFGERVYL